MGKGGIAGLLQFRSAQGLVATGRRVCRAGNSGPSRHYGGRCHPGNNHKLSAHDKLLSWGVHSVLANRNPDNDERKGAPALTL
jgi:hypothetical protein